MIYGLVPIGGKGTRLGLAFSKEMLPQKGFLYFNPISNHLVNTMQKAGAERIIFIHGFEFKKDVLEYYNDPCHLHFLQKTEGFANVLREFLMNIELRNHDIVLFGMPDTVFRGNPFHEMLKHRGITCALFRTNDQSKVDRLYVDKQKFAVKQSKSSAFGDRFWGLLKFDGSDMIRIETEGLLSKYTEIGNILNQNKFTCVDAEDYLDLGTWDNYNYYLKNY